MNLDKIAYWLFADRIPLTKSLIVTNVLTFVYTTLAHNLGPLADLVVFPPTVMREPWTLLTYPIVNGCDGILCLVFTCYWFWVAGGSLERSWGSRSYAIYFGSSSAIVALALTAGWLITGVGHPLMGLLVPLAGVTVAFALLNPEQVILLFFVLPIKLKYVGILSAAMIALSYGAVHVVLGLFSLAGCAFSYWFVHNGAHWNVPYRRARSGNVVRVHERESLLARINPLSWARRYHTRRRLQKLFEDSGADEDNKK